ncbi:MAG TPA: YhjD/YihY/BrkB family envelope integrity protein, partial [Flavisolibacter sp.]|nr:YhjD/YihY/BrkB family envelope integrity protein [Flavisolibacter sp.]
MKRIRSLWKALKMAGEGFIEDNAFKLSASLSYYTIYALGPLFVIIISLAGIFFGNDAVEGRLYAQLNGLVGSQAALQIQDIIGNIQESKLGTVGAIVGGIVLFIGATGVFTEMQDS